MLGLSKIRNDIAKLQTELYKFKTDVLQNDQETQKVSLGALNELENFFQKAIDEQNKALSELGDLIRKCEQRLDELDSKNPPKKERKNAAKKG